jgi:uncharacterized protein YdeI (YjbR/CyaY-like superfamily)
MPLRRPLTPMPADVRHALEARSLLDAYDARPPYQRNDYLSWIERAHSLETRQKRPQQMLDKLGAGTQYLNMAWRPKTKLGAR